MVTSLPKQLQRTFAGVQERFVTALKNGRDVYGHPGTKGEVSEQEWITLLNTHLPARYKVDRAFVIDCEGEISEQIDVVIYDRHFTPVLHDQRGHLQIPAESVYAVFEVKQDLSSKHVRYASQKVGSVRRLKRTSAPIFDKGIQRPARTLPPILGGLLTYESSYTPPFSPAAQKAIQKPTGQGALDLVCVADIRTLEWDGVTLKSYTSYPIAAFYMLLVSRLQKLGSVPAIDYDEYLKHLG